MNTQIKEFNVPQNLTLSPIGVAQILVILRAYLLRILLAALLAAAAALVYSKLAAKTFESTATMLIGFDVNDPISNRDFPSQLAASYLSTQLDAARSPETLGMAIDALGWVQNPKYIKLSQAAKVAQTPAAIREFLAQKVLNKELAVTTLKDSRQVYLSYKAETAEEAAQVANVVAQCFLAVSRERTLAPFKARKAEYDAQLETLRQRVDVAQQKVTEFRNRTGLVNLDAANDGAEIVLRDLQDRLVQAEISQETAAQRERMVKRHQIQSGDSDTDVEFLGNSYVQGLKSQLTQAEAKFAEISKTLGPRHPEYIAQQAEITSLRQRLSRENQLFYSSVGGDAEKASGSEAALRNTLAEERNRLLKTRALQEEAASLVRELDTARKIHESAINAYDRVLLPAQGGYSNVSLLSPATPPLKHIKPITRNNVILGFFAGLFLSVVICFVWELTHRRVRCMDDLSEALGDVAVTRI